MSHIPPFMKLADRFADPVTPASFPRAILRYRGQRWADNTGLGALDEAGWTAHFARFQPLPDNLPQPLALRYHGHQFGNYNPQLGDGRGFLFAQLRDDRGRLLDLGTKGSGQTPWSRQGDGRLTLKGGVREVLAANYLEALGVNTSKPFSLIETGEDLHRGDEPSPARSSVFVRLSHSHIRFGSFQRCAYFDAKDDMAALVDYCVSEFYPDAEHSVMVRKTCALFEAIAAATGRMIGQWMAAGFVHGVMNTDNFNISGETFDFGPWRFLPRSDPNFTAAYFDHQGLYRFGRQPIQGGWALQQLASALLLLADADDLARSLQAYEGAYQKSFAAHTFGLLGLEQGPDLASDLAFLQIFYGWMTETGALWPQVFFDWYGGQASEGRASASPLAALYRDDAFKPVREGLYACQPTRPEALDLAYFQADAPVSLLIDEVEALWAPIAQTDNWSKWEAKLTHIEQACLALGLTPGGDS